MKNEYLEQDSQLGQFGRTSCMGECLEIRRRSFPDKGAWHCLFVMKSTDTRPRQLTRGLKEQRECRQGSRHKILGSEAGLKCPQARTGWEERKQGHCWLQGVFCCKGYVQSWVRRELRPGNLVKELGSYF